MDDGDIEDMYEEDFLPAPMNCRHIHNAVIEIEE